MLSRERMQERFLELVQIYSPSGGEMEQCQWLMDYFKERGIEASIDEAGKAYGGNGGNIIAHVKGEHVILPSALWPIWTRLSRVRM